MTIEIAGKSSTDLDQLRERSRIGVEYIELQLFERDVETQANFPKIIDNIVSTGMEILVVHTPINEEYTVEGLGVDETFNIIENTCVLAEEISSINGKYTHVIIHQELTLKGLKIWGMYETIKTRIEYLLRTYPNIIINIENVTSIEPNKHTGMRFRGNYAFDSLNLCKALRKDIVTDRIGVVLDTCHAIASIRLTNQILKGTHYSPEKLGISQELDLKQYFIKNKQYLNIIHLANSVVYGWGDDHGLGFHTDADMILLKDILGYIDQIRFNKILTIEVSEKDYLNCVELEDTFKKVKEFKSNIDND